MTSHDPGAWPVVLTPYAVSGEVDLVALDAYVDWLIDHGAAGLFPVALSGEMYELTAAERVAVAERVCRRAAGRVPVAATALGDGDTNGEGATGGHPASLEALITDARSLHEVGVDAVVLVASAILGADDDDERFVEIAAAIAEAVPGIALGVYECPIPTHRLLADETVARLSATGRFVFFKETSHDLARMARRAADADGTALRVFNAGIENYAESVKLGVAGLSGWIVNVAPDLVARLGTLARAEGITPRVAELQALLQSIEQRMGSAYPASAKEIVARRGVAGWTGRSRWRPASPDPALMDELAAELERAAASI